MKFLNLDSPFMQIMNKVADLMWINILTLICCIPVVTVGASLTAMHYMALKIVRDEECYITKEFFKSFKMNFKQGTAIWLIMLFVFLLLVGDFYIMNHSGLEFGRPLRVLIIVIAVLALFVSMFVFPVLAKFDNTVLRTIKNSFFISILQFPKTILMMIFTVLPIGLFIFFPQITPILFLFGLSAPAWASAKLYNKFFQKLEDQFMGANSQPEEKTEETDEDARIFRDELDEALLEDSDAGK